MMCVAKSDIRLAKEMYVMIDDTGQVSGARMCRDTQAEYPELVLPLLDIPENFAMEENEMIWVYHKDKMDYRVRLHPGCLVDMEVPCYANRENRPFKLWKDVKKHFGDHPECFGDAKTITGRGLRRQMDEFAEDQPVSHMFYWRDSQWWNYTPKGRFNHFLLGTEGLPDPDIDDDGDDNMDNLRQHLRFPQDGDPGGSGDMDEGI